MLLLYSAAKLERHLINCGDWIVLCDGVLRIVHCYLELVASTSSRDGEAEVLIRLSFAFSKGCCSLRTPSFASFCAPKCSCWSAAGLGVPALMLLPSLTPR